MYKIEECFRILQKYSLVQWKGDQQSYAMHKLVHACGYNRLTWNKQDNFSQATFELVVEAVKNCGTAPRDGLRLVTHVMAKFAALARAYGRLSPATESLIDKLESVRGFVRLWTMAGRACDSGVCIQREEQTAGRRTSLHHFSNEQPVVFARKARPAGRGSEDKEVGAREDEADPLR
jgi:hypothetical protein